MRPQVWQDTDIIGPNLPVEQRTVHERAYKSMAELRVGIIGCGALGRWHAHELAKVSDVRLVAVSDPIVANIERLTLETGVRDAYSTCDHRDLLDQKLDAVVIASPDALHVSQVLDALAADAHVLCEKPLTFEPDEVEAVLYSAKEVDRHVALSYPRRYAGDMRALHREIRSGRWGCVESVMAYNAEDWVTPNTGTWRHDPELCPGGFFFDASGHQLDAILWMTGLKVLSVSARVEKRGLPVPIFASGQAWLEGDVPFTFTFAGDAHMWREQIAIHCEGTDFVMQNLKASMVKDGRLQELDPLEPDETSTTAFIKLIRGEGANHSPVEDYAPLLQLTRAAIESSETGSEIHLRPS